VPAEKARGFVEAGIAKVLRHQHEDGGFGLWPGTPAELHYTAYGLWGLQVAKSAGYAVDAGAMERGVRYLREHLREEGGADGEVSGRDGAQAFALYVLATLGQPDSDRMAQLYAQREHLPVYGRAFLARALQAGGQHEEAAHLADELAALVPHAGLAIIREGQRDLDWYWSSDERSTALVLSALLEIRPRHPAVGALAEGLLAARVDGRWATTQENLYSVLALVQLGKARAASEVQATVSLGGKVIARHTLGGHTVHVRVPLGQLGTGPLVIEGKGDFFYAARVRVERPMDAPHTDRGITVSRTYLDPDSGAELTRLKVGQLAKVRVIVSAQDRQAHVAVVDRLPAGVEPVLTRFTPNIREESAPRRPLWWEAYQTTWQQQELHDDRAAVFADVLGAGQSTHEYLVRAVAAGTYAVAPATVEAMYRPQVHGQSAAATLEVLP
jgi:uncharacterized protein YfaS (alpha-2-macroglobulin family)